MWVWTFFCGLCVRVCVCDDVMVCATECVGMCYCLEAGASHGLLAHVLPSSMQECACHIELNIVFSTSICRRAHTHTQSQNTHMYVTKHKK